MGGLGLGLGLGGGACSLVFSLFWGKIRVNKCGKHNSKFRLSVNLFWLCHEEPAEAKQLRGPSGAASSDGYRWPKSFSLCHLPVPGPSASPQGPEPHSITGSVRDLRSHTYTHHHRHQTAVVSRGAATLLDAVQVISLRNISSLRGHCAASQNLTLSQIYHWVSLGFFFLLKTSICRRVIQPPAGSDC